MSLDPELLTLVERAVKALEAQAGFAAGSYQSQRRIEAMVEAQGERMTKMLAEREPRVLPLR